MILILADVLLSLSLFGFALWLIVPALVGVRLTLPERTVMLSLGVIFVGLAGRVISS